MSRIANWLKGIIILYLLFILVSAPLLIRNHSNVPIAAAVTLLLAGISALLVRLNPVKRLLSIGLADDPAIPPSNDPPVIPEGRNSRLWFAYGLALTVAGLAIVEIHQPYFFTQDDNFAYFLPGILQACRSAAQGVFCTWNPYQFMGMPMATNPQSLCAYPPVYFSYLLAGLFGNHYLTVEILSIFHVLLAYIGVYWLARLLGIRRSLSAACAICLALSGYSLILGRSWVNVFGVSVWTIFLFASLVKLVREPPTWKWMVWTGLTVAILLCGGHPQAYIYSLMFFILAAVLLTATKAMPIIRAFWLVPALLLGIGIASPVLVPSVLETTHFYSHRTGGYGEGIQQASPNLLLPYPLAALGPDAHEPGRRASYGPIGWGSANYKLMGQLYYSGTLFYLLAFIIFLASITYRWNRRIIGRNIWLFCGLIALILAVGPPGALWILLSQLPLFSKFSGPFKFLAYLNLFVTIGAGIVASRILGASKRSVCWEPALVIGVSALMIYHCALPMPAFYSYGDKPYPALPEPMRQMIGYQNETAPQRLIAVAPDRSPVHDYTLSMKHNFPTVYRILSSGGYDPLIARTPENLFAQQLIQRTPENLGAYGIRWIVVHRLAYSPVFGPNPDMKLWEECDPPPRLTRTADLALRLPEMDLWRVRQVSPIAFFSETPNRALAVDLNGAGARIHMDRSSKNRRLVLNFLRRPWTTASVDGRSVPARADGWGRIVVDLPADASIVEVKYSPPWRLGFLSASGFILLAVTSAIIVSRAFPPAEVSADLI